MPRSLRNRLFIFSVLLAVVPLLVVAAVVTWFSFTVHRTQAVKLEHEVAVQLGNRITERLQYMQRLLSVSEKTSDLAILPGKKQREILLDMLLFGEQPFDALVVLDLDGNEMASVERDAKQALSSTREWWKDDTFITPLKEGRSYFGPVSWKESRAMPYMTMAVPIHEPVTGSVHGVLVAFVDLGSIQGLVTDTNSGDDEDVYVMDDAGRLLAHSEFTTTSESLTARAGVKVPLPVDQGIHRNSAGRWVVRAPASFSFDQLKLIVVAERNLTSALGLALSTLSTIVALVGISFIAALGVGYVSIRRIVKPVQQLAATARAVRGGVLSSRAPEHGKDEIGELAVAFNAMTDQLEQSLGGLQEKIGELTYIQERLRESEQQYRDIYEHASEGIFLVGVDGTLLDANPQALSWLGYDLEEITSQPVGDLVHPEDTAELPVERVIDLVREGHVLRLERRYRRKDGAYLNLDLSTKLIGDNLIQTMFRDVTERKHMEEELVRAKNAAEEANKAKGVYLATMSHEIRTPLSNVIGMAELTLETEELGGELRESLEMILDSAVSLIDIINDILDLAKIEARGITLAQVDFDLRKTLERTLKTFETQAGRKGDKLHLEVDLDVPPVLNGDPGRLAQVVRNLVHNAIKFTENGDITLGVSRTETTQGRVSLLFTVRDTGIGVPKDKLNKLFLSFTQVDSSYQEKYKGTGLGLAISKKLVELMGGTIWVASEEGRGAAFNFTAKLKEGKKSDGAQPVEKPQSPPQEIQESLSATVLFAEDNAINQLFISDFLRSKGHRVTAVGNGKAALAALEQEQFDIVLMDIQMPEMDGMEATTRIREGGENAPFDPAIPIVALTAYAMRDDVKRFLENGMDGVITKPVDRDLLERTVQKIVREYREQK